MASTERYYSNTAVAGLLGVTMNNTTTSFYMSTTPVGYPSQFPFTICLDGTGAGGSMELVSVASGAGTPASPWVCSGSPGIGQRGFDGTTATSHTSGVSTVSHDFSAYDVTTSRTHEASGQAQGPHGLPAAAWDTAAVAVLEEVTLANATTSAISWTSIPATYNHLLIHVLGRLTETTQQSDDVALQINGDSGSNYSYLTISSTNASGSLDAPASFSAYGGSSVPLFRLAASEAGAAVNCGAGFAWLPWYAGTAFNKAVMSFSGAGNGTSSFIDGRLRWGFYNPAQQVAISQLTLAAPSGSYFSLGTSFGLYGLS